MLPKSANAKSLLCKMCTPIDELKDLRMSAPTTLESEAHEVLIRHQFHSTGRPDIATESAVLACSDGLQKTKVDVLMFSGLCASPASMLQQVAAFLDGREHFTWSVHKHHRERKSAAKQSALDRRISETAAKLGYKVLRVAFKDMRALAEMAEFAWSQRGAPHGWVFVSKSWNSGAHMISGLVVRGS